MKFRITFTEEIPDLQKVVNVKSNLILKGTLVTISPWRLLGRIYGFNLLLKNDLKYYFMPSLTLVHKEDQLWFGLKEPLNNILENEINFSGEVIRDSRNNLYKKLQNIKTQKR